jgi:tetratricopeptide (TPR) repeat protein
MRNVVEQASEVGVVHWIHGLTQHASGDMDGALAALTRAIEIDPDAPAPLFFRADLLAKLGRLEEALRDLDTALDDLQAGTEQEMYFRRGEIRRMLAQYRRAIEDFDRALNFPPREPNIPPSIIASRGQAKLGLGNIEGALEDLDAGLEKNPSMAWALISRSTARLAQHDVDGAIADRRRVVELLPNDAGAWAAYGMMLLETDRADVLWRELSEAVAHHNHLIEDANVQVLLARAAIATGRFTEAEQHFHAATELAPTEDFWIYEEARAVRHQGRAEEALAMVETALRRVVVPPPDNPVHLPTRSNRCLYLLAAGRDEEAEREWTEYLRNLDDPDLARTALRELDELQASGHWSPTAERIRDTVRRRIEELTSTARDKAS